jgi:hypothetical protein
MGSQGMKRKGRQHLPKVGTAPDNQRVYRQSQKDVINFGRNRESGNGARILFVAIAVVAALVLLGFIFLT